MSGRYCLPYTQRYELGAVVGVLRTARRTPPAPAVTAQGAPAPEAARKPPTAASG